MMNPPEFDLQGRPSSSVRRHVVTQPASSSSSSPLPFPPPGGHKFLTVVNLLSLARTTGHTAPEGEAALILVSGKVTV